MPDAVTVPVNAIGLVSLTVVVVERWERGPGGRARQMAVRAQRHCREQWKIHPVLPDKVSSRLWQEW